MNCPLRSPEDRPKPWKETVDAFDAAARLKPFKCEIPMHPGKQATIRRDTVAAFWTDIHEAQQYSLYRDFTGIIDAETKSKLISSDALIVEPGNYILGSRTYPMIDQQLYSSIDDGVARLKEMHPLANEAVACVQQQQLLLFNHSSLFHEGNSLSLDETKMLTDLLAETKRRRQRACSSDREHSWIRTRFGGSREPHSCFGETSRDRTERRYRNCRAPAPFYGHGRIAE